MNKKRVLTDAEKAAMIRTTHDAASAMIDDLQYMRETFSKPAPTAGDLRRMSGVLRRLLIDNGGDLRKIAPPRIGRIELLSLDTLPLERANRKQPWHFLVLGKALLFRAGIGNIAVHREIDSVMPSDFDRNKIISLSLDGFLAQKVMCFQGEWASRAETIKYVANVAHGVHSGDVKERNEELLRQMRHMVSLSLENQVFSINVDYDAVVLGENPLRFSKDVLDVVSFQLASTAQYVLASPDILRLEETIQAEQPF